MQELETPRQWQGGTQASMSIKKQNLAQHELKFKRAGHFKAVAINGESPSSRGFCHNSQTWSATLRYQSIHGTSVKLKTSMNSASLFSR